MKKAIFKAKNSVENQKKIYILLIGLAILATISGIIFIFLVSEDNLVLIKENLIEFFSDVENKNRVMGFGNAVINNLVYILAIWLLGISVIGAPLVIIIMLFKFFVFGFSISSIIYTFKWKGILTAIVHLLPHQVLFLISLILVTFYSISFSVKLFSYLFFRKSINFKEVVSKYLKVLLICVGVVIAVSFYEAYVSTFLLGLFN